MDRRNERRNTTNKNIHGINDEIKGIQSYHGFYDPLSYPILFSKGKLGRYPDIPKIGVSMEDVIKARAKNKDNGEDLGQYTTYLCIIQN